jgi:hypothetical protein
MKAECIEAQSDPHAAGPGLVTTKDPLMSLQTLLTHLLSERPEAVQDRVAGEFHRIAAPLEERLAIARAGRPGKRAPSGLRSAETVIYAVPPERLCENAHTGRAFSEEVTCLS